MQNIDIKKLGILIFSAIVFTFAIFNLNIVLAILKFIIAVLFPLILAIFIAFILNIPMKYFEKLLNRKSKKKKKLKRVIAIVLSVLLVIFITSLLLLIVIPEIYSIIKTLINNIPLYEDYLGNFLLSLKEQFPNLDLKEINTYFNDAFTDIKNGIFLKAPDLISFSIEVAKNAIGLITSLFLAIILSFNILMEKEKLKKQLNQFCYAYLKKEKADKVIYIIKLFSKKFSDFISPVYIEAVLFGIICYISMRVLHIPYAGEISCLVGFMAFIPVVGVYIGMIIGGILIVSTAPIKALIFIILMFILKEVDSNILYPRFIGKAVGLPAIWVLVSVMIGAGLFGLLGMLFAVPVGSIIYTLVLEDIKKKNNKKDSWKWIFLLCKYNVKKLKCFW